MADGTTLQLKLPSNAFQEIGQIVTHAALIPKIRKATQELGLNAGIETLVAECAKACQIPEIEVRALLNGIQNLYSTMSKAGCSPEGLHDLLTAAIESQAKDAWKTKYLQGWKDAKPLIIDALGSMSPDELLAVDQKTRQLTFLHENVLTDSSIVTDVRPVFNQAGDTILRTIVTHVLIADYQSKSESKRVTFALDAKDLRKLLQQSERALQKALVLEENLPRLNCKVVVAPVD